MYTTQRDGKKASSSAFVTNIFIRPPHSDRYFLSTHIASLTPGSISSSNTVNALKQVYRDPTRPRKKTSTGACVNVYVVCLEGYFSMPLLS